MIFHNYILINLLIWGPKMFLISCCIYWCIIYWLFVGVSDSLLYWQSLLTWFVTKVRCKAKRYWNSIQLKSPSHCKIGHRGDTCSSGCDLLKFSNLDNKIIFSALGLSEKNLPKKYWLFCRSSPIMILMPLTLHTSGLIQLLQDWYRP